MQIEEFTLERIQSLYENLVEINLSDSGVHPYALKDLLTPQECQTVLATELGYGWTNGSIALREAIAGLYRGRGPDDVIVTNGSAEANFLIVMTLLDPGDEIVVIVPNYLQIYGWAKALAANVREVRLREQLGWLPDLDEVRAAVSPRAKVITICTPNNPTGRVAPPAVLEGLVDIARTAGLWLHSDEVYKGSEYGIEEAPSVADLYERAIVTNGLSKAMAMPGLRIGWLVGPPKEIYAAWQRKDYTSITTSAISEVVATMVLRSDLRAKVLARSRDLLSRNVAVLTDWAKRNRELVTLVPPQAGGMAFVRYHPPVNSTALVHTIREKEGVLLAPGDAYGMDGYVRIAVGGLPDQLAEGLERTRRQLVAAGR